MRYFVTSDSHETTDGKKKTFVTFAVNGFPCYSMLSVAKKI